MKDKGKVVFVGLDASKATLAVSVADDGRDGEIRDWGTISTAPSSVDRFLKKLASRFERVEICYEAGPTGYGLVLCFSQASMQQGSRCPAPYICRSAAAAGSCWAWSLRTVS